MPVTILKLLASGLMLQAPQLLDPQKNLFLPGLPSPTTSKNGQVQIGQSRSFTIILGSSLKLDLCFQGLDSELKVQITQQILRKEEGLSFKVEIGTPY